MLTATQFMAFVRDGSRKVYEDPYFLRRRTLIGAALGYCLGPRPALLDCVVDHKGVHITTYLMEPTALRLMLRLRSPALAHQAVTGPAGTVLMVQTREIAWKEISRVQLWPEKATVLLYAPNWWMRLAVPCSAFQYEDVLEFMRDKVGRRKDLLLPEDVKAAPKPRKPRGTGKVAEAVEQLFHVLISQSNRYKDVLMPGYTHLQIAMPSSFGLWFGAYAESLVDDMMLLQAAFKMCNRNPLGSAAGYGSSFPLNREMTTRLLGFDSMNYNVVYAQMGRGKMERNVAFALASIAGTVSKLAFDACMFSSQNFGFVKLPDECTTGSSIMPHKKNPDVFELTRAKCNKIQALPQQIMMIMNNLPSGYFRDLQIIKEVFLPAFQELKDCLQMTTYIMDKIKVNEHILDDDRYLYIFSVEEVNRLAAEGMPFRDAYKKVGLDIEAGKFTHNKQVHHTHEGSIGNLCNDKIILLMEKVVDGFNFSAMEQAEKSLLDR